MVNCYGSDTERRKIAGRTTKGGGHMLTKVSGLARTLYIILAIVAGFVALGTMPVALVLVALGLVAGISLPKERMGLAAATILALPTIGTALAKIPAIGAQLNAVCANLQLGMAGAFAM